MVRGGGGAKKVESEEADERKRLRKLAFKSNLLSETQATVSGTHALSPSKTVIKHHGKDIVRKSQRSGRNRFLFSFPGLLAPISGGKIGELKDLSTKNPVLYLDFPQGQMKLFGTIVYPKNRYLTLQFSRSGKNVTCEDYFDNMIVFSDAWWIGRKDENPEEARLEFPEDMNVVAEYDFKGGAAGTTDRMPDNTPATKKIVEQQSPKHQLEDVSSDSQNNSKEFVEITPSRKSARMARKTFKFVEASSGDDFVDNGIEPSAGDFADNGLETSGGEGEEVVIEHVHKNYNSKKTEKSCRIVLDLDKDDVERDTPVPQKGKQSAKSASKTKELADSNRSSLVQATISTLFKKAGGKKVVHTDLKEKTDNVKISRPRKKGKAVGDRKDGTESSRRKKQIKVEDDDIEEFTSTSQDMNSSDEEWAA